MNSDEITLWQPKKDLANVNTLSQIDKIIENAINLRPREQKQIISNLNMENYEIASSYVWIKSMTLLKQNLASMGMDFIGELLQRPDINIYSDPVQSVSDMEAISLAYELGAINATQRMRFINSASIVNHFASSSEAEEDDSYMQPEEANLCIKTCVQTVLGLEKVEVAKSFIDFRDKLNSTTLSTDSTEISSLLSSPYFFKKTTVSILLNILKTENGAQLENGGRNATIIIPKMWDSLKGPERWQVGQAYSELFNEGKKKPVQTLHNILIATSGFDYVPESLRSNSFTKAAHAVLVAHQGIDNFYTEAKPMEELALMGSSIPGPALAHVMTATLAVKLGNQYGVSFKAEPFADDILNKVTQSRWDYYLENQLPQDTIILAKLTKEECVLRWIKLMQKLKITKPSGLGNVHLEHIIAQSIAGESAKKNIIIKEASYLLNNY